MADENNITIMDNTINIADYFVKSVGEGAYNVYFKALTEQDQRIIEDWLKQNIQYSDIKKAPTLPSDNKAYDENNNIKPFDKLAFTADYDDLNNAPTIPDIGGERPTAFNPIAFTGVVNLDNVAVSNVINLSEYSINTSSQNDNINNIINGMSPSDISINDNKMQNVGNTDMYIKGLGAFAKNGNGKLLFNELQSKVYTEFYQKHVPTYLISNSGVYFLTDIANISWNSDQVLEYFELHLVPVTDSNYSTIRTYETNITDEAAEEILENIELSAKNVILIFDFNNNILYCKTKEVDREQEQGIFEETDPIFTASPAANINNQDIINWNNKSDFSGNYNNLNGAPALPEDTENNSKAYYTINEGETNEERKIKPFNLISFTGDYNDLSNKPNNLYMFLNLQNFSNIISPSENLKLQTLGESNNYILDFNHFQNSNNLLLSDAIKTLATYYYNYSKECVVINALRRYNIINIKRILLNNNEDNVSLISMDYIAFNNNNYETIRYNGNSFDETVAAQQLEALTITKQTGTLFFDYQNNVIYCKINNI